MKSENTFIDINDFILEKDDAESEKFPRILFVKEKSTNIKYSAKELDIELYTSPESQESLDHNIYFLSKIHHNAIAKYRGFSYVSFQEQKKWQPTILTEYAENKSIQQKTNELSRGINQQDWTSTKKYIVVLGISSAMNYLHQNNIIHGNLKPGNVLLDKNHYPKICDLLQCKKLSDDKMTSPAYVAPEILQGELGGSKSDVYSFAMVAYEILTGTKPYPSITEFNVKVMNQIIDGSLRPNIPSNFNKNMKELLEQCWDKEISKRPTFTEIYSRLSQNFKDFQDEIDENEINSYLQSIADSGEILPEERPKGINDDFQMFLRFFFKNPKVGPYFQYSFGEAFASGNSEIVNLILSTKLIDVNSTYEI